MLSFGLGSLLQRSLFEDGVHVCSREPVGRHCRPPGRLVTVSGPRRGRMRHKEVGLYLGKLIGQPGEVQIARNHTMLQGEDRLHQPQHSGG